MLLERAGDVFNTSLDREPFTRLDRLHPRYFWRRRGDGVGEPWRGAKVLLRRVWPRSRSCFTVHFMYDSALAAGKTDGDSATGAIGSRLFDFLLRAKYAGGRIWRPGGSDGALAGGVQVKRDNHALYTAIYPAVFRSLSMARPISSPDRC